MSITALPSGSSRAPSPRFTTPTRTSSTSSSSLAATTTTSSTTTTTIAAASTTTTTTTLPHPLSWPTHGKLRIVEIGDSLGTDLGGGLSTELSGSHRVKPGDVDRVSPRIGDVHVVSNATSDRTAISIHVYGANIGAVRRHVFDPQTGAPKPFVSGYSSALAPNLWDRSKEARI